jgi:hypothetical protein
LLSIEPDVPGRPSVIVADSSPVFTMIFETTSVDAQSNDWSSADAFEIVMVWPGQDASTPGVAVV